MHSRCVSLRQSNHPPNSPLNGRPNIVSPELNTLSIKGELKGFELCATWYRTDFHRHETMNKLSRIAALAKMSKAFGNSSTAKTYKSTIKVHQGAISRALMLVCFRKRFVVKSLHVGEYFAELRVHGADSGATSWPCVSWTIIIDDCKSAILKRCEGLKYLSIGLQKLFQNQKKIFSKEPPSLRF